MMRLTSIIILLNSTLLIACGGTSSQTAGIDGSGQPVAVATTGTIDGFGSVIVNGIEFESDRAQILINNQPATENDLRAGYHVSLSGTIANNGTAVATKIEYTPNLVGQISAIDNFNKRITVLGQEIQISNTTLFDAAIKPRSLSGLSVGNSLQISGTSTSEGLISASRIDLVENVQHQLTGQIRLLTNSTFTLNNLLINYAGAQLINIEGNRLQNGMTVNALGNLNAEQLTAVQIIGLNKSLTRELDSAAIEGFITRFNSASDFDVDGIQVSSTEQTRFEQGSASDLRLGVKVEVEGRVDASGRLVAKSLEFELQSNNKITGKVTAIQLNNNSGILSGQLEVDGVSIMTTKQTRYEDKLFELKRFNLGSITLGDALEVSGYSTAEGFIATKIEREDADDEETDEREIEGVISALGDGHIVLLGRKVFITEATQITGNRGNELTLSAFLLLALNQQIEVKGFEQNGLFYASEMTLKDDTED